MKKESEKMNDGVENKSKPENQSQKEKPMTSKKTAAAVAAGMVVGNIAWGLAREAKGAVDDYIVDVGQKEEVEQLPDGGIEPAEVSDVVTDDMSFNEAFAAARSDVGPGGIFEWNGNQYGTYYKEEWDNLTPEETDEYWASVEAADINIEQEVLSDELLADVAETADLDGDGYEESVLIDSNIDGDVDIIAADLDADGEIDTVVADTDFDGEADKIVQDTDGDGLADLNESIDNEELLADSTELEDDNSSADLDNDADMSEWA